MTSEEQLDNLEKKLTVLQCALQEVKRATMDVAAAWRDLPPALAKLIPVPAGTVSIPSMWTVTGTVESHTTVYPENGEGWIVIHGQDGRTIIPVE